MKTRFSIFGRAGLSKYVIWADQPKDVFPPGSFADDGHAVHHVVLSNTSHDVHAFGHAAKDRVIPVEERGRRERDVKLRACAVRIRRSRHRHGARLAVLQIRRDLERNVLARSAHASAMRTSALDDEVWFNAMEFQPVVKIALSEFDEVRSRDRGEVFVKDDFNRAFVGFDYCRAILVLCHYFLSDEVGRTSVRPTSSLFPGAAHCDMNDSFEIRLCQKSATNYDDSRAICKPPDRTIKGAV